MFWNKEIYRSDAYKALRDAYTTILEKHLTSSGFTLFKKDGGGSVFHHYHRRSDFGYDYVSVQFDKYARPLLTINIAKVPAQGVQWGDQHIEPERVDDGYMSGLVGQGLQGRLYKNAGGRWLMPKWYGLSYSKPGDFASDAVKEIDTVLADFKYVEDWFANGRVDDKHLRIF